MQYDFCFIASWSKQAQKQLITWGTELEARGYSVAVVSPSHSDLLSETELETVVLEQLEDSIDELPSVETIESRYEIPSLGHLIFSEQQLYDLSRSEALSRAVRLAASLGKLFSEHRFECTLQGRGPEIHRLLAHYITKQKNGTSIWYEFSPFDDSFALSTTIDGSWDNYRTVPHEEISESERRSVRQHIENFREERRLYTHEDSDPGDSDRKGVELAIGTVTSVINRTRPGALHDQIKQQVYRKFTHRINNYLLPTVEKSRQLCEDTAYVFFPLQYPIESRLTVFSPQFYDQLHLIRYLRRILPSCIELFVKPHPNHPGRPEPRAVRQLQNDDRITFLHYATHSHEVIEQAEAIVVVNNTIGYESIYFQKPLIAVGNPTYAKTPAVTNAESLEDLPAVLSEKISTKVSEEAAIESIYSLQNTAWQGDMSRYDAENVQLVVGSILEFLHE